MSGDPERDIASTTEERIAETLAALGDSLKSYKEEQDGDSLSVLSKEASPPAARKRRKLENVLSQAADEIGGIQEREFPLSFREAHPAVIQGLESAIAEESQPKAESKSDYAPKPRPQTVFLQRLFLRKDLKAYLKGRGCVGVVPTAHLSGVLLEITQMSFTPDMRRKLLLQVEEIHVGEWLTKMRRRRRMTKYSHRVVQNRRESLAEDVKIPEILATKSDSASVKVKEDKKDNAFSMPGGASYETIPASIRPFVEVILSGRLNAELDRIQRRDSQDEKDRDNVATLCTVLENITRLNLKEMRFIRAELLVPHTKGSFELAKWIWAVRQRWSTSGEFKTRPEDELSLKKRLTEIAKKPTTTGEDTWKLIEELHCILNMYSKSEARRSCVCGFVHYQLGRMYMGMVGLGQDQAGRWEILNLTEFHLASSLTTVKEQILAKSESHEVLGDQNRHYAASVLFAFGALMIEFMNSGMLSEKDVERYPELALGNLKEALGLTDNINRKEDWAAIHTHLGHAFRKRVKELRSDNLNKAVYHHKLALRFYSATEHPLQHAQTLVEIGSIYLEVGNSMSALGSARECFASAIAVYEPQGMKERCALLHEVLGDISRTIVHRLSAHVCYWNRRPEIPLLGVRGDTDDDLVVTPSSSATKGEALDLIAEESILCRIHYGKAQKHFESTTTMAGRAKRARLFKLLAKVALSNPYKTSEEVKTQADKAIAMLKSALRYFSEHRSPVDYAVCHYTLAACAFFPGVMDVEEAISSSLKAISFFNERNFPNLSLFALMNLAMLYRTSEGRDLHENASRAIEAYERCLRQLDEVSDTHISEKSRILARGHIQHSIGLCYVVLKSFQQAVEPLVSAVNSASAGGIEEVYSAAMLAVAFDRQFIANCRKQTKDDACLLYYTKALYYYDMALQSPQITTLLRFITLARQQTLWAHMSTKMREKGGTPADLERSSQWKPSAEGLEEDLSPMGQIIVYNLLGLACFALGDIDTGCSFLYKMVNLIEEYTVTRALLGPLSRIFEIDLEAIARLIRQTGSCDEGNLAKRFQRLFSRFAEYERLVFSDNHPELRSLHLDTKAFVERYMLSHTGEFLGFCYFMPELEPSEDGMKRMCERRKELLKEELNV